MTLETSKLLRRTWPTAVAASLSWYSYSASEGLAHAMTS